MGARKNDKESKDERPEAREAPIEEREGTTDGEEREPQDWLRQKSNVIDQILTSVETQLTEKEFKATIGDFIRLFQLRKEMEDGRPREITVTWLEPCKTDDAPAT